MEQLKFEKLIKENLSRLEDIELVLLKGHLIIEQLITELLELNLSEPNRLKSINLMFAKKLDIYLAIKGNGIISKGLEIILKDLNSLRNKLAHNLNHPDFNDLLIDWVQRASKKKIEKDTENEEFIKKQLIISISYISAFLSGAIEANKKLN